MNVVSGYLVVNRLEYLQRILVRLHPLRQGITPFKLPILPINCIIMYISNYLTTLGPKKTKPPRLVT